MTQSGAKPGRRQARRPADEKHPVLAPEDRHYHIRAMKFTVTIDRDESGAWVAECPAIPGCVSQGATKPEALKNVREAIELCLEVRAERGLPLTIETKQVEVAV
jgi:predicted RNase H-like HicB family nuclease